MLRPRAIRRLDDEAARALYWLLKERAPLYLERRSVMGSDDFAITCAWEGLFWAALEDDGGALLSDWRPRLSIRMHPVVWGKKLASDRQHLREILLWLKQACNVERIEVLIPAPAPDGLRRWCLRAGFLYEGRLRRAAIWDRRVVDGDLYSFVED